MADTAIVRINPERTNLAVERPDGTVFGDTYEPGSYLMLADEDTPDDDCPCIVVMGDYPGLKSNTVYRLVPIDTMIEEGADLDDDGEGEPGDDEDEEEQQG